MDIRFGILSTASVNAYGFLPHVPRVPGARVLAVASRDARAAAAYAKKHRIPRAYGGYDALLSDPDVNAVYIPLPTGMHHEWTLRALRAGKHVLCEKPMAASRAQAQAVAAEVAKTGLVFSEGYHYMHHPLFARIQDIVSSGGIGDLRAVRASFGVPLADKSKVQFDPDLGGGALRDTGCYPVSFVHALAGGGQARVLQARARRTPSGVDGALRAELLFDDSVRALIKCSIEQYMPMHASVHGTRGDLFVMTPFTPAMPAGPLIVPLYALLHRKGHRVRGVRVPPAVSYQRQIEAFRNAVRTGAQPVTSAEHGAAVLGLIDAIYAAAGMGQTPAP